MRVVPIPDDLVLPPTARLGTLGPPAGVSDEDCATVRVIHDRVRLPSGRAQRTVAALVQLDDGELEQLAQNGGHLWLQFFGDTFPPVVMRVAREDDQRGDDHDG
jgi:hypothetical protein